MCYILCFLYRGRQLPVCVFNAGGDNSQSVFSIQGETTHLIEVPEELRAAFPSVFYAGQVPILEIRLARCVHQLLQELD